MVHFANSWEPYEVSKVFTGVCVGPQDLD